MTQEDINKLVTEAILKEREECAKICDASHFNPQHYTAPSEAKWLAILIRSRETQ
jgi:hypothetical protein